MENVNGATRRDSHRTVFDVVRPIVRLLRASGVTERTIRSQTARACRLYADIPPRGVWVDPRRFAELAEVLAAWTRDPEFIDAAGMPRKLELGGGAGSFRTLLRRAGCSVPPREALALLLELGSIRQCEDGRRVRLVSNVAIAVIGRRFIAPALLDSIRRFVETLEFDLCEDPGPGERRMLRWATCAALDPAHLDEAQRYVRSNGQTFIEAVDEKLGSCAARGSRRRGLTYGVGLYVFIDRPVRRPRRGAKRQGRRRR